MVLIFSKQYKESLKDMTGFYKKVENEFDVLLLELALTSLLLKTDENELYNFYHLCLPTTLLVEAFEANMWLCFV